tara:strand:- start:6217 stop:6453 length:237 start_codon:yes stop_codon:yes gene_type:complete
MFGFSLCFLNTIKFNKMPIHNEIFDSYRLEVKEIHNAIKLLAKQGYTVIDLEGQVITKWNVESGDYPNITYNRTPKQR